MKKLFELLNKVSKEAMSAIGQAMIAPSEIGKQNGGQDMGVYRLQSAANSFHWCANRIEEFLEEYGKEVRRKKPRSM